MNLSLRPAPSRKPSGTLMLAFFSISLLLLQGCQKQKPLDDPQLNPIQQFLETQIPVGTPLTNVMLFLNAQGFPLEPSQEPRTLVAKIRKIDTQRMEPVTARVTFYFDAHDKLASYELQRLFNDPVR